MKLQKKSEIKDISKFKDMDLFKNDEEANPSEDEDNQEQEDDENKLPKFHRLNWMTSSKLYDSAILVKEINAFY